MRGDRLVLCYHGLSVGCPSALMVEPGEFARQIELLAHRGYRGVTFSDVVEGRARGRVAAVTFDDALVSVREHAHAVLTAHGWPATVFVPTAYAASEELTLWSGNELWAETPWVEDFRCLGWEELRALAGEGWELGSHSHTHAHLAEIEPRALREELERSRAEVEEHSGRPCETIGYPYSSVDPRVMDAAGEAGYRAGAATYDDGGGPRALRWPRLVVSREDRAARFSLKSQRDVRRLLANRALARAKARVQAQPG